MRVYKTAKNVFEVGIFKRTDKLNWQYPYSSIIRLNGVATFQLFENYTEARNFCNRFVDTLDGLGANWLKIEDKKNPQNWG